MPLQRVKLSEALSQRGQKQGLRTCTRRTPQRRLRAAIPPRTASVSLHSPAPLRQAVASGYPPEHLGPRTGADDDPSSPLARPTRVILARLVGPQAAASSPLARQ